MLLAARVLADCAADDLRRRALARYTFLWGDALVFWARRWRKELSRTPATARHAAAVKPQVEGLASVMDASGGVRDYLAAKRQPMADVRADDMEATVRLWGAVNRHNVDAVVDAAVRAYDALAGSSSPGDSIVQHMGLSFAHQKRIREVLPSRDERYWHLSADTAADLRPNTLPAAQGGNIGRLIAQANDVAIHLDVLLRIAPEVHGVLIYDWLARSAIGLELSALLDLTIGPPPGAKRNVTFSLLDLCRQGRAREAAADLEALRDSIAADGHEYVRWMRNTLGAHADKRLSMFEIHQHLVLLDYRGIAALAEHVLNWLDSIGARHLDLKLLLLNERTLYSWPVANPPPGVPDAAAVPGSLARLFRSVDSPYMAGTVSGMGSAVLAGVSAGRQPEPRTAISLPPERGERDSRHSTILRVAAALDAAPADLLDGI
jgi:hypothetical protein